MEDSPSPLLYRHQPLACAATDVRLADLLPGAPEDEIHLRISHTSLAEQGGGSPGHRLDEVAKTLPQGWIVRRTPEGRLMYARNGRSPQAYQRQHPEPAAAVAQSDGGLDDGSEDRAVPDYEALSYAWGADGDTADQAAWVVRAAGDGWTAASSQTEVLPGVRRLPLRRNLMTALQCLRRRDTPRRLWIDAVCINQDDDGEKSEQVRRMGSIFRLALGVVAFLGAEADSSTHALRTLDFLGRQVELIVAGSGHVKRCRAPEAVEPTWCSRDVDLGYTAATWNALAALLQRPYFMRLWIVQEVRLARHSAMVQCGTETVPLHVVRRAIETLRTKTWLPTVELRAAVRHAARLFDANGSLSWAAALALGDGRHCADPRDRVYAVLGLAPPAFAVAVVPDYAQDTIAVFTHMTLAHVRHTGRLELLGRCAQVLSRRRLARLPSWVPDLTVASPAAALGASQFAAGFSRTDATLQGVEHDSQLLHVLGRRCAVVDRVCRPIAPGAANVVRIVRSWQPDAPEAPYPAGGTLSLAHAITLRAGRFTDREPGASCPSVAEWLAENARYGLWGELPDPEPANLGQHCLRVIDSCTGRTYVRTREGYVGLAPPDAQPGDIIAVLLGCASPVLLRPANSSRSSSGHTFTVVGECFVHGLQDAIGLLGPLPAPWRVQVRPGHGRRFVVRFTNTETREVTADDPRLGSAVPWERIEREPGPDDPEVCAFFRHQTTGEVVDSDPRMGPDALSARGVPLERFCLA